MVNTSDVNLLRKYNIEMEFDSQTQIPEINNAAGLDCLKENVITYMSGYVIRMAKRTIKCEECLTSLEETIDDCVDDCQMQLLKRKNRGKSFFNYLYQIH